MQSRGLGMQIPRFLQIKVVSLMYGSAGRDGWQVISGEPLEKLCLPEFCRTQKDS